MKRFKQEPYITQRQGKLGWTFQVRIRTDYTTITKSFSEKEYGSARVAYDSAVVFRNRSLIDIADNTVLRKNNITVQEAFDEFIDSAVISWKTKDYHQKLFKKYIIHKTNKLQDITRADIIEELNGMVEEASDDTIGRVLTIWKNDIVEYAITKDYLVKDITVGIKAPQSRKIMVKKGVTTDRETVLKVEDLILHSVADKYNARVIIAMLETLYYTGMRPAEVAVLKKEDIKKDYISVTKELGSSINEHNVVRKCKTPSSIRNVPIHPSLRPALDALFEDALYDEVFVKKDGSYMDSTWVGDIIRRLCKKNNIEFNMYRLRHNMATNLVTNNVDPKTTVELMGHANYDMSIYYASSNDDLKEDAIGLLS